MPVTGTVRLAWLSLEKRAAYRSSYGDILVVAATTPGIEPMRLYVQNGGVQGGVDGQGRSVLGYPLMVEHALRAVRPEARRVLVVGLGAGVLPRGMAEEGRQVTVIEIDRNSVTAAERHFGLLPDAIAIRIGDARILLDGCSRGQGNYDAVILDAFSGIELPEHLLTVEAFREVRQCLTETGIVLANFMLPAPGTPLTQAVLRTIHAAFGGDPIVYRKDWQADPDRFSTLVVLAGVAGDTAPTLAIEDFPVSPGLRRPAVIEGRRIGPADLIGAGIFTDRRNNFAWMAAAGQVAARREITVNLPPDW